MLTLTLSIQKLKMDSVLNYESVDIYQDEHLVLEKVSLTIHNGNFVYLLGKSGSGKTSLIRSIYADIPIKKGKANV